VLILGLQVGQDIKRVELVRYTYLLRRARRGATMRDLLSCLLSTGRQPEKELIGDEADLLETCLFSSHHTIHSKHDVGPPFCFDRCDAEKRVHGVRRESRRKVN